MPDVLCAWAWRCPDCLGSLVWIRDNFQGRRLLAVLMHEAEATAEELMERGILRLIPETSRQAPMGVCCCDLAGVEVSPGILAARRKDA